MFRSTIEPQQFLAWTGDLPFLIAFEPVDAQARITFQPADSDFNGTWCDSPVTETFPLEAVSAVGLERWVETIAAYRQQLHVAETSCHA